MAAKKGGFANADNPTDEISPAATYFRKPLQQQQPAPEAITAENRTHDTDSTDCTDYTHDTDCTQSTDCTHDTHNTDCTHKTPSKGKAKSKRLNVLIPPVLFQEFSKVAHMKRASVNGILNQIMAEYVAKEAEAIRQYNQTFKGE